ncbi:DinB family protein [Ornithinimicrobium pratense]|uniref:DinB family protein n=1 Tax=Ornithinimicrobium pratense TaxID=2593973 RepID=A0A5J6V5N3_9MICO|nr:DinB family protein [Ornithinimicrobium pratense]QFG68624.1 DinB family protein [Ornithinimicrobium pratense]
MTTIFDPMDRAQTPLVADEKAMLLGMLAFQRDTLRWKCSGLTAEQLAFEHAPSELSLGGLLKHLAVVEVSWVRMTFAGGDDLPAWKTQRREGQDGWSLRTTAGETPQVLFRWLTEAQQLTERIVGEAPSLQALSQEMPYGEPCSLRWVLLHLVQEYGRHLGHADLIREAIDGTVGI